MDLHLTGRVALVCGSSSGLGLSIAGALAGEGCRVALNGRDPGRLEEALTGVRAVATQPVAAFAADVSQPDQVTDLVERVRSELGAPDILVANAGGPPATTFAEADLTLWQQAVDLNLLSTITLCRATVPGMRERGWGRVICLTSVSAKQPIPNLILSSTARAGVLGFAKSLASEVAAEGVTVNVICPGYMRTDRVEELFESLASRRGTTSDEIVAGLVQEIPAGRIGEPEELAAAVAFLASNRAGYITGVALQVDGGYVRSIF